jgi:hypothetical protein
MRHSSNVFIFFSFNQVTKAEEGQYLCVVENEAGSASAVATIEVHSLPTISGLPTSPMHVTLGQRVRLECRAEGHPTPTVTWKRHRLGPGTNF